jgi:hypothetical protein
MIDTTSWEQLELDVLTELHCDPHNVRLETTDARVESDIIGDLFANERALELVEAICKVGYLTHDLPVALMRGDQYVVVEGNRRLAALKAIQNPMLVPDYQARINALVESLPSRASIAKIPVLLAPDQDSADQLIAAIHTGNLRRPWGPARQAAFFQAQIDGGRTLAELVPRYPTIDVRKFVLRAHMINEFRAVRYPDPELTDFLATRQWVRSYSTLERIFESRAFQDLTGFDLNRRDRLTREVPKKAFAAMATIIVRGLADGDLNTRSLNSVDSVRFKELIADLRAVRHGRTAENDPAGSDAGTDDDTQSKSNESTRAEGADSAPSAEDTGTGPSTSNATSTKSGRADKRRGLSVGELVVPSTYPHAVHALLAELAVINVRKLPNTTFLGMRAALEKTIKAYADARNAEIRKSHNANGFVQLSHALDWLLDDIKQHGPKKLIQPVDRVRTGKLTSYAHTGDALNAVNHNHEFEVDPDEAIGMWHAIEPIMKHLMKP